MYVAMSELLEKPDSKRFKARNAINRHFKTDLRTGASLCNNLDSDEYLTELVELAKELGFSFGAQITKKEIFCLIAEYAKPIDVPMISELSDFKKEEILRNALYQSNLKNVKADGLYLQHILPEHQTTDICLAAIHNDGLALKYVHKQTPRICSEAVKENGHALQYVYEEYKTTEICLSALRDDGLALKYISKQTNDYSYMCLSAVTKTGHALQYVDKQYKTLEICLAAIERHAQALRYVNCHELDLSLSELYLLAVKRNAYALEHIPSHEQTTEMQLEAVRSDGTALRFVDPLKRTPELCLAAVRRNGGALMYVSAQNQTLEICLYAVKRSYSALYYVVEQTHEICLAAVRHDGWALMYVKTQTPDICLAAIEQNELACEFINDTMRNQLVTLGINWSRYDNILKEKQRLSLKSINNQPLGYSILLPN